MLERIVNYCNKLAWGVSLMRAGWCSRRGRNDKALQLLTRAIELNPEEYVTYLLRAWAWERLGKPAMALADYNQAAQLNPTDARVFYNRGALLQLHGRYQEAIADYTNSLLLKPGLDLAFLARAYCWLGLDELDKGMSDLDAAIKLNPNLADAYLSRGIAWSRKDQLDKALADLNEAIRRNTNWLASAFYNRAGIRLKRREIELSIDDYTKAIQHDPECADCFLGRSTAFCEKGDFIRALADGYDAIRLAPENALAHRNLGCTLIDFARYEEGLASFEKGLTVDPNCAWLLESIAWLLATCPEANVRDGKRALELADQLKNRTDVSDWEKLIGLAAANAECGNFDAAVAYQAAALEKISEDRKTREEEALKTFRAGLPRRVQPQSGYSAPT